MTNGMRLAIGIVAIMVFAGVLLLKARETGTSPVPQGPDQKGAGANVAVAPSSQPAAQPPVRVESPTDATPPQSQPAAPASLPRLVDLGSKICIQCRMMAPILDELKAEYAGQFAVEFIDVREDREAGYHYKIRAIPTQVFIDAAGNELFRHEGFYSKADILAKWKALGVNPEKKTPAT